MPELRGVAMKSTLRKLAPSAIRPYRILRGPLRGRIIVTSLHDYPGAILGRTERPLLDWFQLNVRRDETWLDVGAHYGYTAIALAEIVGAEGRVFAFEPSLTTAGCLNRTRALNGLAQIKVVPLGLAEGGGLRVASVAMDRGMANHAFGGAASEDIYLVGFDQLWKATDGRTVHGVKIDVQGMELQALEGMSSMLTQDHPKLVIEFHAGVARTAVLDLLGNAGYRIPGIPILALPDEVLAAYHDDRSYFFEAASL
jgi:FkbM family methyltransferase